MNKRIKENIDGQKDRVIKLSDYKLDFKDPNNIGIIDLDEDLDVEIEDIESSECEDDECPGEIKPDFTICEKCEIELDHPDQDHNCCWKEPNEEEEEN